MITDHINEMRQARRRMKYAETNEQYANAAQQMAEAFDRADEQARQYAKATARLVMFLNECEPDTSTEDAR